MGGVCPEKPQRPLMSVPQTPAGVQTGSSAALLATSLRAECQGDHREGYLSAEKLEAIKAQIEEEIEEEATRDRGSSRHPSPLEKAPGKGQAVLDANADIQAVRSMTSGAVAELCKLGFLSATQKKYVQSLGYTLPVSPDVFAALVERVHAAVSNDRSNASKDPVPPPGLKPMLRQAYESLQRLSELYRFVTLDAGPSADADKWPDVPRTLARDRAYPRTGGKPSPAVRPLDPRNPLDVEFR